MENVNFSAGRQCIIDVETTGLSYGAGDKIVEIAAVEVLDFISTGRYFHVYVNPRRDIPAAVTRVHGITNEFVVDQPTFDAIAPAFLEFIRQDQIVAHNIQFDYGFINHELKNCGQPSIEAGRKICTLEAARRRWPGQKNSLDAICDRLNIDRSLRVTHGALKDCWLLAEIWLELNGGRQLKMDFMG